MKIYNSSKNTFYRIITIPGKEIKDKGTKKEYAYHRPFEQVANIGNYRFSMNGFPCLYLGHSKKVCGNEIGHIKDNTYKIISTYHIAEEQTIKFLNIAPQLEDTPKDLYKFFLLYPLYLASLANYTEKNTNKIFHEEYIIPQLLMLYVRKYHQEIDGIRFLSSYYKQQPQMIDYINYVLPVTKIKEEGYDDELMKKFEIEVIQTEDVETVN